MIEVEMGQHDVTDIRCGKTQSSDLVQSGILDPEANIQKGSKKFTQPWMGMMYVFATIAGIDQNQALIRLDQLRGARDQSQYASTETIEERTAERAVRSTSEIMNLHQLSRSRSDIS
jgi:hypothetical protein